MNIYDYLKMDHQKVAHLFQLFEQSKNEKRQKEIVCLITQELMVHAHSEQEIFYKELAKYPESKDIAEHGEKEHLEIDAQLEKIAKATPSNWHAAVLKLKELVEHHVREEENEAFKKAQSVLSDDSALILKEKMHYLKGIFLLWLTKEINKAA